MRWIAAILLAMSVWVIIPWLAPVAMQLGWEPLAKAIYWIYSFQCHQLPQRSFFLFGPQSTYSLTEIAAVWPNSSDPAALRQFIGSAEWGYKVAWSDRMVSAYSTIPLAGILWWIFRRSLRPLPIWSFVLLALPMAIDGGTHMISDLAGIGEGFRFSNEWLATLTANRLPETFYSGTTLGSFNSGMRLITGALFGLGLGWFAFPHLGFAVGAVKVKLRQEVVGSSRVS